MKRVDRKRVARAGRIAKINVHARKQGEKRRRKRRHEEIVFLDKKIRRLERIAELQKQVNH